MSAAVSINKLMPGPGTRSSRGDRKERADHAKPHKRLVKNGSVQQRSDGTTSIMLKAKKGGERKTGEKAFKALSPDVPRRQRHLPLQPGN